MQAVLAAEVGHLELAYDYFAEAALMDLDDLEHNTRDGLHIASLAGAYVAAIAGFGGIRDQWGNLTFTPRLPQELGRLTYRVTFRGRRLRVKVTQRQATYTLVEGEPLEIVHNGQKATVTRDQPVRRRFLPRPQLEPPSQPPGRAPVRRRPSAR